MNADFLTSASPLENIFLFCAICGAVFFIIRFVMMLMGAGTEGADAIDGGMDMDMDGGDVGDIDVDDASHSDTLFGILSINTVTAFVMMFGWAGLTCYKQFSLGAAASIIVAFLVGVLCMLITAYLFKLSGKLVSKGGTFNINTAVGKKASVYQQIPADGKGRINLNIPGSNTRELNAVSADHKDIESFKTVKIVKVIDNNTVSVKQVV